MSKGHSAAIDELRKENEELREEIAHLRKELEKKDSAINEQQEKIDELKEENQELGQEIYGLKRSKRSKKSSKLSESRKPEPKKRGPPFGHIRGLHAKSLTGWIKQSFSGLIRAPTVAVR